MNKTTPITNEQIEAAAKKYPHVVTGGPMAGFKHPADLLRWVLGNTADPTWRALTSRRRAENYIRTGNGECWNAMCRALPANGWIVWSQLQLKPRSNPKGHHGA